MLADVTIENQYLQIRDGNICEALKLLDRCSLDTIQMIYIEVSPVTSNGI